VRSRPGPVGGDQGDPPDLWRPTANLQTLRARAALLAEIRTFFAERGVLEVETPVASRFAATDPAVESLVTQRSGPGGSQALYLQTSPELPMKRLLAAGAGPIFQICKVFRDGERGRLHHPEFSLLEWYRPGWSYLRLIEEVADLVRRALGRPGLESESVTYRGLFLDRLGVDPWSAEASTLRAKARGLQIPGADALELDRDGWLDLLLVTQLEPGLGRSRLSFLTDYPPSQAALARIRPGAIPVAERFELYLEGVELANGFQELTDVAAQEARFAADLAERCARGLPAPPVDGAFLAALAAGMPEGSGVALGLDRLLMARLGARHIDEVLAFPIERA
jgi:elongation factor P--(R)-beta-lysine ligase